MQKLRTPLHTTLFTVLVLALAALASMTATAPASACTLAMSLEGGSFGTTVEGQPVTRPIFLQAVGGDAYVQSISTPNGFVVASTPLIFYPWQIPDFSVHFFNLTLTASAPGTYSGYVQVSYQCAGSIFPSTSILFVTGTVEEAIPDPPTIDVTFQGVSLPRESTVQFDTTVGSGAVRPLYVHNTGGQDLHLTEVRLVNSPDFVITDFPPATLAPGQAGLLRVKFLKSSAAVPGTYNGTLRVHNDSVNHPNYKLYLRATVSP